MVIGRTQQRTQSSIGEQFHSYALPTIAAGVIIAILYWARVVFITTIISVIIALILEPLVGILIRMRIPRSLATLIVGMIAALALYFAGLAAYRQLSGLASDVPAFKENLGGFITGVTGRIEEMENATSRILVPARKTETAPAAAPVTPQRARKKGGKDLATPPQVPLPVPGPVAVPGALTAPNIPEVRDSRGPQPHCRLCLCPAGHRV